MQTIKRMLTAMLAVLSVLAAGTGMAGAQTRITLGYTGAAAFLPAFVAKEKGFFQAHGLDVALQLIPVGSTMPGALVSQSLQVATLTAPVLMLAADGGLDLGIASAASYQSKQRTTTGAVSRMALDLKSPADYRRKKVGVPGLNSVQHILFMKWLQNGGVKPNEVTYVEAAFPQMGDMLRGGSIDVAVMVEPFLSRVVQGGAGKLAVSYAPQVTERYLEAFYAMDKGFVQKNPKVVKEFKAAINDAVAWTQSHEAEARGFMTQYLRLPKEVAMEIPLPEFSADFSTDDVRRWIDLNKEFGLLRSDLKAEPLILN